MVQIPVDGQQDALFKRRLRIPAEIIADLLRIDAVAAVMAEPVRHMLDQILADAFVMKAAVQLLDDGLDDEDIRLLIVSADVVNLANPAVGSHHVNRLAVVFHIQPVAHLHAVAVDRQLLVVAGIVDHQRNQLLRKLVRPVVVGAAGDVDRHAVGVMERAHKMIRAGLGSGIRAVRAERSRLREIPFLAERAVHLIRGHLQILAAGLPGAVLRVIPGLLAALQQIDRAHHIGLDKDFRIVDGAVHMGFRREVDDAFRIVFLQQGADQGGVADIALHKHMAGILLNPLQILQIAGIGQFVQIDNLDVRMLLQHVVHEVRTDEAGAAGDKITFHFG